MTDETTTKDDLEAPEVYAEREARRRQSRDYNCYVTAENLDHIAERFRNLVATGRRMTVIEHIGESRWTYKTQVGQVLSEKAYEPIEHRPGSSVYVRLSSDRGHGLSGFGVSVEPQWPTLRAVHAEQQRHEAFRKSQGIESDKSLWDWHDPQMRHLEYVEIIGGLDGWVTTEDQIRISYVNEYGVAITREVYFDTDRLRATPHPKVYDWDIDDSDHAQHVLSAAPAVTRWAVVKDLCDRLGDDAGQALWNEYAALDVEVRPYAHGGEQAR